jgi:hypothetical protein
MYSTVIGCGVIHTLVSFAFVNAWGANEVSGAVKAPFDGQSSPSQRGRHRDCRSLQPILVGALGGAEFTRTMTASSSELRC